MSMRWYVVRRLMWTVFATWLALTITFGLLTASPNTGEMQAAFQAAAQGQDAEAAKKAYRKARGLDEPVWQRYVDYIVNMATLNWGWSTTRSQPVIDAITDAWPYSAQYIIPSTAIAILAGYGIGLYSAMNQYTVTDYIGTFIAFFGISIPNFWFAIMLILIGGVWLQDQTLFGISLATIAPPTYYRTDVPLLSIRNLHQIILPVIVVSTASVAGQMRYSRAQALEYVNAEFVKTARAKGASDWRVLTRHILRVALVPLATILVADVLAIMFAGAVIAEVIFQIPGIGLLGYKAIIQQDTPLVLATTLIPVFIAIFGNLLQDLAYVWLDPRIDYGDR
ncbi:MAG: ABC transporter permease [Halobacteriales archaeon]|nr:ABC transporter permease [Halobacteriales archaeon]